MLIARATSEKTPILVVDDSRTVRAGLSRVLTPKFSVIEAEDGEDGWRKLQANGYIKLVITDIMMPKLDGYGLICRIRGADNEQLQKLPIIVVTSAEDELSRERAHACGANNFIVKPAKSTDLIDRVNFHTEEHLNGEPVVAPQMAFYKSEIETAIIEIPDIDSALAKLKQGETGPIAPYAIDLALEVIPLLEYCNNKFDINIENEIRSLRKKLQAL